MSRILIVDDEPAIGWSLREVLSDEGHAVEVAASVEAGLETCSRQSPEASCLMYGCRGAMGSPRCLIFVRSSLSRRSL